MRRRPGFTLIEIILVTSLVGLVLGLVGASFLSGVRFHATVQRRSEQESELVRLAEQVRFQFLALNTSPVRRLCIEQISQGEGRDEVTFVTSNLMRHGGIGDVSYRIEDDDHGRPFLAYREHPFVLPDVFLANPGPYKVLSTQVSGLTVEYEANRPNPVGDVAPVSNWQHTWELPQMPARIRITLYLGPRDSARPFSLEVEPALMALTPQGETPGVGSPSPSASASLSPSPAPSTSGGTAP